MALYAFGGDGSPGHVGSEFGRPRPAHALTPGALAAVEAVERAAWERRHAKVVASIVTEHGNPKLVPYDGVVVTPGARRLLATALELGWKAQLIERSDRCVVEGIRGDVAFRAVWTRGRASASSWHERRYRYGFVEDTRPIGKKADKTKTSLAGRRPVGVDPIHLTILGSPRGVAVGVTEIEKRVKSNDC